MAQETEQHLLGGAHVPLASAHFCVSKHLTTKVRARPGEHPPGATFQVTKEKEKRLKEKGKDMKLVSSYSLYFSCFLSRKFV